MRAIATRRDLTTGPMAANIWHLAAPLMVAGALQDLFNIVDMIFVGRLGPNAIAGVSMGGVVVGLIRMLSMGISTGTVALVSRFVGRKEEESAESAVGQSLLLGLACSAVVALLGAWLSRPVLRLLGAGEDVAGPGGDYLVVMTVGAVAMFMTMTMSAGARGFGDAITPMWAMGIASVVNVVGDPLLIFGIGPFPRLGTAGAALATVFSQAVGATILAWRLYRGGRRLRMLPTPGHRYMARTVSIGVFSSARMLSMNLSRLFLVRIASSFGTFALAAFGIGLRLRIFSMTLGFSLADATAVVVGQNLGARQPERAESSAWISVGFFSIIVAVLSTVFVTVPSLVIGIFNDTPEVVALGTRYLYFFVPALVMMGFAIVLSRAIDGAGDTMATMIISFVSLLAVGVPVTWALSRLWGTDGVWAGLAAGEVIQAAGIIAYFRAGRWKRKKL
jgi:putative MATE family efflux protein